MLIERTLTYRDLRIDHRDIYRQMGYGDADPGADVCREMQYMERRIAPLLRPRFQFVILKGRLDVDATTLTLGGSQFQVGKIIARQLRGSDAFALFVATSGIEFEHFQHEVQAEGDMVSVFIADAMGSVIAEAVADRMEEAVQQAVDVMGWKHTNRFSPGYCGWHVSGQQQLFPLMGTPQPCGVELTPSSLMVPIKSVSGVIGLGREVRKLEYTCGLCTFDKCYKRRKKG